MSSIAENAITKVFGENVKSVRLFTTGNFYLFFFSRFFPLLQEIFKKYIEKKKTFYFLNTSAMDSMSYRGKAL